VLLRGPEAEGVMGDKEAGDKRRRLDSVIPEIIKRAVELGVEKAAEAPDNLKELVGNLKLPREAAGLLMAQAEETKNGLFRVVAKEVRDFLEHTNLATEMQKMLTTVQFEISTTIRFKSNDGPAAQGDPAKMPKPEVKSEVRVKRAAGQRADGAAGDDRPRERRRSRE
jgi:hypothetical protein